MLRVVEREWVVSRRLWRGAVFSTFLAPVLFLAAMGLGLGGLVDEHSGTVAGFDYLEFVAPGLMAASAMQIAAGESMWPVMGGVKWVQNLPRDGGDADHAGRGVRRARRSGSRCARDVGSAVFLLVAALLGGVPSVWGVLAIPAAALVRGRVLRAAVPRTRSGTRATSPFAVIMRIGVFPLFLFSGTFFPISRSCPTGSQPLAVLSPLWHGVELCRDATTGSFDIWADVVARRWCSSRASARDCCGAGARFARRLTA